MCFAVFLNLIDEFLNLNRLFLFVIKLKILYNSLKNLITKKEEYKDIETIFNTNQGLSILHKNLTNLSLFGKRYILCLNYKNPMKMVHGGY